MSCSKIDDLEDLANNIFQFEPADEKRQKAQRDRLLKKQQRRDKIKQKNQAKDQQQKQQQIDDTEVDFYIQAKQKVPGTHNIYVKTFGCSHNISDSQFMIGQLADYGYNIVNTPDQADLILINSCTVKNPSQDAFLSMVCKAKKIKKPVVVAGCVPQGDQNIPELNQVSALGVTQIDRVVQVVQQTLKGHKVQLMDKKALPSLDLPKIRKNKDIEIIPINAGCLGACTYCKTVFARGKLLSYAPQAITARVANVVKQGIKQIWLTSEDTGAYGRDLNSNISELLISLCQQLKNHDKIMIRLGMTNPPYMLDHLGTIAHFLNHPRVFSFIHIPVQAGHNNVLEKMNRQYTVQQFKTVCDYFLQHVPDVTIATDMICGFAQQTDEEFQGSMKLVQQYKFKVLYINQFYLRPGTPAANLKQLPSHIIKQRSTKMSNLFKKFDSFSYMIGNSYRVWINEVQQYKGEKHLVGHTKNYTKVNIPYNPELLYKQVLVKITTAFDWHVEGQIIQTDLQPLKVQQNYAKKMREDLQNEKIMLQEKKKTKLAILKQRKKEILNKLYEDKSVVKTQIKIQTTTCCSGKGCSNCSTCSSCSCNQHQQPKSDLQIKQINIQSQIKITKISQPTQPIIIQKESGVKESKYDYKYLGVAGLMFFLAILAHLLGF